MTEECKKLVEDNHNLIFFVINKMGLSLNSIEDWYGVAAIGLCKAAITYDESKGFTFSTYATRCMTNMILISFRTNKKLVNDYLSLDEHVNNDGDIKLQDTLIDPNNIGPEYIELYNIFQTTYNQLNDHHKGIVYDVVVNERTQKYVADKYHCTRSNINRIIMSFRKKLKEQL